ncbi:MAG: lysine--tRNA ligase, partial [Acidobacteria bacterium]|nr:lysine--tRNA ligase [Acidobacteriota bacterium]
MFWADEILEHIQGEQTINDSKTPSGRVHVGALRGVLIHDAVFQVLKEKKVPVRYLYGVDDYDPVDEIPAGMGEIYREHLGKPLFSAPPPPGSSAGDMAEHYISEFFDVFKDLEVHPEIYRMRDVYRSGRFNSAIDRILSHAADVRRIYFEVSNSVRPESWFPFQTICEQCGRIGTTEVFAYDGKEVSYRCRRDLVKWAEGCGYEGKVSPFDGKGKLPWKLEWVAKWAEFPVTIEGAGKDHSTRGGSRDVSEKILREVFGLNPPLNIPYEFFLVGGAKMSSSKGLGASAREMCDFLPQDLLRFLMIRPKPQRPVNFEPDE